MIPTDDPKICLYCSGKIEQEVLFGDKNMIIFIGSNSGTFDEKIIGINKKHGLPNVSVKDRTELESKMNEIARKRYILFGWNEGVNNESNGQHLLLIIQGNYNEEMKKKLLEKEAVQEGVN